MGIFKKKYAPIVFEGKKYAINLEQLKKVCLSSSSEGGTREYEISQVYEAEDNDEMRLSSKVEHETKVSGNPQNDMIVYDVVKVLILSLLDKTDFVMDFGTTLAINTLLSWGVLEELE
jgi:hypothetical protein